jgi:DNA-binding CsgD family transcriptional regulator
MPPSVVTGHVTRHADLVGRTAESAALSSFLELALTRGDGLLVTGEAGVGKTALLEEVLRHPAASSALILRAAGVEFEAEVSFAGLNQLLLPLIDDLEGLPPPHRDALCVALGLAAGPPPHQLLVSTAVLALLTRTAEFQPVLLVVDDAMWLDRSSMRVLGFVARRLGGRRIALLAAARTGSDGVLLQAGLAQLELAPLAEAAASDLLQDRFPGLAPHIRQRVLATSDGNPLALLELPAVLTESQRTGLEPLPPPLPLGSHLPKVFAHQLVSLPPATRQLLLLAALDGSGDLRTLTASAADDHWLDDLGPAERARLVSIDLGTQRVRLRHPLIASTAVELATSGELRRAHRALADALVDRPEESAWHLAEAVVGTDARAADLVEVAAQRARRKGDVVRAVTALLRAAELTPAGPERARRLAAAAFVGADATGSLRDVPDLLSAARAADPGTEASLEMAAAAAHHLLNGEGDVDTAHLLLVRALEQAIDHGSGAASVEDALHSLMLVCHFGGRADLWRPFETAVSALRDHLAPVLAVSSTVFADPVRSTTASLQQLDALITTADANADPTQIVRLGMAAFYADRLSSCRQALRAVVSDGRSGGAVASAVNALMMLCHEAFEGGRWQEAERTAEEGIVWGEEFGYRLITMPGVYCSGLLAAVRGDGGTAHARADELVAWSAPRGARLVEDFARRIRGLAALGRSDFEKAYQELDGVSRAGGFAAYSPVAVVVAMDLVEAAVRAGHRAEAEAHVRAMEQAVIFSSSPRLTLLREASAALVAPAEDAVARFEQALSRPDADRSPFEFARVRLAYGEHLRRARATAAARLQLTAALETFESLGARPWVTRASNELHAAGLTHPAAPADDTRSGPAGLTAQEHQIALLAATGLSNKEIGSRLYLSPRTVGAHLYRIFPKLGISSRAALRDALSGNPA